MGSDRIGILYFLNTLVRGGVEEYVLTLLQKLDRQDFRLYLACPPTTLELLRKDVPDDVETIPLLLKKPRHVAAAAELGMVLRKRRIGILHSHLFYASLFASPIGWACRTPVIMETPHIREHWRRGLKAYYAVDRMVARCVDYYVAVSHANAYYLAEEKGIPAHKIRTIHFGHDLKRFSTVTTAPDGLRRSLNLNETDVLAAVIGRLEPQKGHAVLLEAMRRLPEASRLRVVCIGNGSLRSELEQKTAELGISDRVRFAGYQTNIADWLAASDISVLPSYFEGLPLAAIESQAAGRAVIATAVDGTPEVVIDGKTGLLVSPGDAEGLARAMAKLAADADLRCRMGEAGRDWVCRKFTEERFLRESSNYYLEAWEKRRA